jgi:prolyl oligopeptidase
MRALTHALAGTGLALMTACATPAATPEAPVPGAASAPAAPAAAAAAFEDKYLWMEEVEGERALAWVRAQNTRSLAQLQADPRYAALEADALNIIRATDRLTFGGYIEGYVSNFWQDDRQVRGVWRRATFDSWRAGTPAWETVLDIDQLAAREGRNWVYQGASCFDPVDYWNTRCLVTLSDGGKDASVRREFDLRTRTFVEGGFSLPEAKAGTAWRDADTLLVGTDWGAGTLTESGYPFIIKALDRGQPLSAARELFRGAPSDVGVWPVRIDDGQRTHNLFNRATTFFTFQSHYLKDDGSVVRLPLPDKHAITGIRDGLLFFSTQEDWTPPGGTPIASGSLVSAPLADVLAGGTVRYTVIYAPGEREAFQSASLSQTGLYVVITRNVKSEVRRYMRGANGSWSFQPVALPQNGVASLADTDIRSDRVFFSYNDMITPPSVLMAESPAAAPVTVQAQPARFDASNLEVQQFEAVSRDGTRVPYFVVHKKGITLNGSTPTLLYGYGGFEVSMLPNYGSYAGKMWLERGGAYVLANIRGGGEFGPAWHQAGLKGNRQVIYDDFIGVAEDLIRRGITSPRRLGAMGGSNGGLLMGVMLTQRPDLFNAVVVQVPLLDMLRYDRLLAGASWVDEYGDPDNPAERPFLERISPYQNLVRRADMPVPFFVTSTKDDRVHPAHARKFAARMEELGMPFLYYENIDGGHSAAANLVEGARRRALEYTYLFERLAD